MIIDHEMADSAETEMADAVADALKTLEAEEADLAEAEAEEALEADALGDLEIEDLLKCMMLFVINARKNARFHSDHQGTSQFYAVIALEMKAGAQAHVQVLVQEADLEEIDLLRQVQEWVEEYRKINSSSLMKNSIKL